MNNEAITLAIEEAVNGCSIEKISSLPTMQQTIALANGMRALKSALTKEVIEELFLPLQGSPLGFRTDRDDKDPSGYHGAIVRDCIIECMIRGFRPIGNEMNIIAGRAYFTKEGFERKVGEFEGLTNFESIPGVPAMKDGGALVPYHAKWLLNGAPGSLVCDIANVTDENGNVTQVDRRIPIRVNSGMGMDAILGKAKRKFYARIYERLTGVKVPDGDAMTDGAIDTVGTPVDERQTKVAEKTAGLVDKHRRTTKESATREPGQEG